MVVSIHTGFFLDINQNLGFLFSMVITRVAVPFFFTVAGYFYMGSLLDGKKPYKKYVAGLLPPYFFWNVINIITSRFRSGGSLDSLFSVKALSMMIWGDYQLWFLPALIFAVTLATLLKTRRVLKILAYASLPLYVLGCLCLAYKNAALHIPGFSNLLDWAYFGKFRNLALLAVPHFMAGFFLMELKPRWEKISAKKTFLVAGGFGAAFLFEVLLLVLFLQPYDVSLTFMLYPFVLALIIFLLKNPFPQGAGVSKGFRVAASFTFYSHMAFIVLFRFLGERLLHVKLDNTPLFLLVWVVTGVLGFAVYKLDSKFLNRIVV